MSKPDLKVVELCFPNSRDPVASLRGLADDIEAGVYGTVGTVAVAMLADKLNVFGFGADCEGPSTAVVLHAGFMKLNIAILEHGENA